MSTANESSVADPQIIIIGAGIIGLCCAYELSRRGAEVTITDPNPPGRGASWAAAGMLSAAFETTGADTPLSELCHASAALWPDFVRQLEDVTGADLGYQAGPTLVPALTDPEWHDMQTRVGRLTASRPVAGTAALRAIEPSLSPDLPGGLLLRRDGQVDNRAVLEALVRALTLRSVHIVRDMPTHTAILLDTRGWQAEGIEPVKGQLLSLIMGSGAPRHVIRNGELYIAPKRDRIIIGATSEPGKTDLETHKPDITKLHRHAAQLCPVLADLPVIETWAGLRPRPHRGRPTIGKIGPDRYVATGHYRNGVLLAPITARLIADQILDGEISALSAAFLPEPVKAPSPAAQ